MRSAIAERRSSPGSAHPQGAAGVRRGRWARRERRGSGEGICPPARRVQACRSRRGFEAAAVGERDRDRARHSGVLARWFRHQPDAVAEGADLRVGQCRLVPAFGVARLAMQRQRDAEGNEVLCQHQIGRLQNIVALDHARGAGDGDRLYISAAKAVRGLQIAHRSDRGMRGGVARMALQRRGRDEKRLAQAAGQLGLVRFRAEDLEESPNSPSGTVRAPAKPSATRLAASTPASEARPKCKAFDHTAVAAGEFEQPAAERPGDAENSKGGVRQAVSRPAAATTRS